MNPLELLDRYLGKLESRFRLAVLARGAAVAAAAALTSTLIVVLITNRLAFSEGSLTAGRVALFLCLALAIGLGIVTPLLKLNRCFAARETERRAPLFDQRLLTIAERERDPSQRLFLELLAADTLKLTEQVAPERVVSGRALAAFLSSTVVATGVLLWLILGGPGFWGYGARMLWAGPPRDSSVTPFYDIIISPGDKTVRRGAPQQVTAQLVGFTADSVRLMARYKDSAKWEEAPMAPMPGGSSYEFLFAAVPETVEYYALAGRMRSKTYTLRVADLPSVKRIRVTYNYPAWTGLKPEIEDPGGDVRAVEGTEAEIEIETDRPLERGRIMLEDGNAIEFSKKQGNWQSARLKVTADGSYYIAAVANGETVRLTEDFFIEAEKDQAPLVRITRPGRDTRVTPIEEVPVAVDAVDDFGLQALSLHYSVNGGPEKTVNLLTNRGAREGSGNVILYLEDYKLSPGDIVALYASARDARQTSKTDIFFVETQPFEREYTQSQQMGGGGGGAGGGQQEREGQISQRQKEIISATWNQLRDTRDREAARENARFLSEVQSKLRDQAQSMSTRMNRRELSNQNEEFQRFSQEMAEAAKHMSVAAERLKQMQWQEALAPEQQALQHLLRAEATYRQIQVAFGNRQGGQGGGGGGSQRDLESLFDLELDTERNQYETGQQASLGANQREREIDEALQRLEQLARRQQELANRMRQPQQSFQQRWQQELLRREAEQLQQQMERLARESSSSRGQRGQGGQGTAGGDSRLDQALRRLSEATEDMRRASSSQGRDPGQGQAESRRAAERLQEAERLMRGLRSDQATDRLDELARRSEQLAAEQAEFQRRLQELLGSGADARSYQRPLTGSQLEQSRKLADERNRMVEDLKRLEQQMQQAARDLAGSERRAASRLREALGELQQNEIETRMRYNNDLLRRGYGAYVPQREGPVTQGLNQLRDQLRQARAAVDRAAPERGNQEQALARLEQLRSRLEEMTGRRDQGQNGQAGGRGQTGSQGRSGERGTQGGGGGGGGRDALGERYADGRSLDRQGGVRYQDDLRGFDRSAMNRGDWRAAPIPQGAREGTEADLARLYQESMRDLAALRDSLSGTPAGTRDIQDLLAELRKLDPTRFPGNPELLERIRTQVLPALEQMELQLRRQLEDQEGGLVRTPTGEPIPQGYAEAVAEYFRRLGKSKQ